MKTHPHGRDTDASKNPSSPWSPGLVAAVTLLVGFLPGAILHALNRKRLGLSSRAYPSLPTTILVFATMSLAGALVEFPRLVWFVVGIAYATHFFNSQQQPFAAHRAGGGEGDDGDPPDVHGFLELGEA